MRDRSVNDIFNQDKEFNNMSDMIKNKIGLPEEKSSLFHLEMWSYVHGIATMMATNYLDLDIKLISEMLTDAYLGILKHYEKKK